MPFRFQWAAGRKRGFGIVRQKIPDQRASAGFFRVVQTRERRKKNEMSTFKDKCVVVARKMLPQSSWDIGLLLALAAVAFTSSVLTLLSLQDQWSRIVVARREVVNLRRQTMMMTSTENAGNNSEGTALMEAAYWFNVVILLVSIVIVVVAIAALVVRNTRSSPK